MIAAVSRAARLPRGQRDVLQRLTIRRIRSSRRSDQKLGQPSTDGARSLRSVPATAAAHNKKSFLYVHSLDERRAHAYLERHDPVLATLAFERVVNARGRAVAAPLENVAHQAVRGPIIRLREVACLVRPVFRFRHLRLVAAPFGANVGTIRSTSKLMIFV